MSGSIASRYIGGVPYGPGQSVGRYPNAASIGAAPGVVNFPTVQVRPGDTSSMVTPVATAAFPTSGSVAGGGNLLAELLMTGLSAAPDLYRVADRLLSGDEAQSAWQSFGDWPASTPSFDAYRAATPGPFVDPVREGIALAEDMAGAPPTDFYANGGALPEGWQVLDTNPALLEPVGSGAPANAGGASGGAAEGATPGAGGWLQNPLGLPETFMAADLGLGLGTVDTGLGAINLDSAAGNLAYLPAAVFAQGTSSFAKPGGELGGQIGTGIGTAIGTIIGGPWGAAAGAIAGGAIGGQIGPPPTVGRNFSSLGTFTGEGGLSWGNSGGDNGASAADADPFANWFSGELSRQAAAHGLGFNPNMAGAQIRVGGYDNFSRTRQSPAGGYFYDITSQGGQFGGSPENYAARPADDWATGAYTPDQARDFATYVLADLTARNVYTPGGAATGGQGDLAATLGADYGYYGSAGGDYSRIGYGGGDFNSLLGARQNAITGYRNDQQQQARQAAAVANTAPGFTDQGYVPAAFDLSQPIWYNGGIVNPGDILFPTQAASSNPWGAVGVDAGLIAPGLFGQQVDGGA